MAKPACPKCGSTRVKVTSTQEGATALCLQCGASLKIRRSSQKAKPVQPPPPTDPAPALPRPAQTQLEPVRAPATVAASASPAATVYMGGSADREVIGRAESSAPVDWNVGDVILDLYEVTGLLGEGGMGKVYKAHHRAWNVDLAVKTPKREMLDRAGGVEAFHKEAETWVSLGLHQHIVSCYYVRDLGGIPRVFAEYVEGGSLHDWITDRRLYEGGPEKALARILDIAIQFAWGLHYAHQQGLVHQDVKPGNVMLTPTGTAKVTDFGLAGVKGAAGTPAYRSPEQESVATAKGVGTKTPFLQKLDQRSDIWSWGVSILEMFTGEMTWMFGIAATDALNSLLEERPHDDRIPAMPQQIAVLLRQCFHAEPQSRWQSMLEPAATLKLIYRSITGSEYHRSEPRTMKENAGTLNNRAVSLLDLGKPEEARELWDRALEIEAHHPESTFNRGLLDWRSGQCTDEDFIRSIEEMGKTHPDDSVVPLMLGWTHMERGDFAQAEHMFKSLPHTEEDLDHVEQALKEAKRRLPSTRRHVATFSGRLQRVQGAVLQEDGILALVFEYSLKPGYWTIRSWNTRTGDADLTIGELSDQPPAVAFSRDHRKLLAGYYSGDNKGAVALWDFQACTRGQLLPGHADSIRCVDLSADATKGLSASIDGTVRFWDLDRGTCIRVLEPHGSSVSQVCFVNQDKWALSATQSGVMKFWDLSNGRCLDTFQAHGEVVRTLAPNSDGSLALSIDADSQLKLWDVLCRRCIRSDDASPLMAGSAALSADGRYAVVGSARGNVCVWETETGRCLHTLNVHADMTGEISLSSDAKYVLSCGATALDNTARLWAVHLGEPWLAPFRLSRLVTTEGQASVQNLFESALTEAGDKLRNDRPLEAAQCIRRARAVAGFQRHPEAMKLWTDLYERLPRSGLNGSWELQVLRGHGDMVEGVCFSAEGAHAVSAGRDGLIKQWDVQTGQCLATSAPLSLHGMVPPVAMTGSHKGRYVVFVSYSLRLFDLEENCLVWSSKKQDHEWKTACFSPDDKWILSVGHEQDVGVWDVATGRLIKMFRHDSAADNQQPSVQADSDPLKNFLFDGKSIKTVCCSPDGDFVLTGSDDGAVKLWNLPEGRHIKTWTDHPRGVTSVQFSPDGRFALSAASEGTMRIHEISTGTCTWREKVRSGWVSSACFTPDGRFVLAATEKVVEIWSITGNGYQGQLEGHASLVGSVAVSPKGAVALSASTDRTVRVWYLDWEIENHEPADWDEAARPFLDKFLRLQTPYKGSLPADREPTDDEIRLALTRKGIPQWTEEDVNRLHRTLAHAGLGWVRKKGVAEALHQMVAAYENLPAESESQPSSRPIETVLADADLSLELRPHPTPLPVLDRDGGGPKVLTEKQDHAPAVQSADRNRFAGKFLKALAKLHEPYDISPRDISLPVDIAPPARTVAPDAPVSLRCAECGEELSGTPVANWPLPLVCDACFSEAGEIGPALRKGPAALGRLGLPSVPEYRFERLMYRTMHSLDKDYALTSVYLAVREIDGHEIAVKMYAPGVVSIAQGSEDVDEVLKEHASMMRLLSHRNIAEVYDVGSMANYVYWVMEYCSGGSLASLLAKRGARLALQEAAPIMLQVLEGMAHAHRWGCVHPEIEPKKILFSGDSPSLAKIVGFGVTFEFVQRIFSLMTVRNPWVEGVDLRCTPREQVANFRYAGPASDVWRLGAIFCRMLTGSFPRDLHQEFADPVQQIIDGAYTQVPVCDRDRDIPPDVGRVLDKALSDSAKDRYQDGGEFLRALKAAF